MFARRTRDVRDERAHSSAEMPAAATFIADMPAAQGTSMTTVAITVEGDEVVAYATNGANDEAYFFGTQSNGQMDLTSTYADRLKASFDGKNVSGEIVMNENGAAPEKFAASPVAAPAGIYTAAHDNSRATWVVGPNHTMVGIMVLNNSAPVTTRSPTRSRPRISSSRTGSGRCGWTGRCSRRRRWPSGLVDGNERHQRDRCPRHRKHDLLIHLNSVKRIVTLQPRRSQPGPQTRDQTV